MAKHSPLVRSPVRACLLSVICSAVLLGCGGGGTSLTPGGPQSGQQVELATPDLLLVAATGAQNIYAEWSVANAASPGTSVTYEIHVSQDAAFTPSVGNLAVTAKDVSSALIPGLLPNTRYYVLIVATSGSASPTTSAQALRVTTPSSDLVLQDGVVVVRDRDAQLSLTGMATTSLTYTAGPNSTVPEVGTFITGETLQGDAAFFRKITSRSVNAGTLVFATVDATLDQVIEGGSFSYSLSQTFAASELEPVAPASAKGPRAQSAKRLDASPSCSGAAQGALSFNASLSKSFTPIFDVTVSYLHKSLQSMDMHAGLDVGVAVDASVAATAEASVHCMDTVKLGTLRRWINVGVLPVLVGAKMSLEMAGDADVTGKLDYSFHADQHAVADAHLLYDATNGWDVTAPSFSSPTNYVPNLAHAFDAQVTATIGTTVTAVIEPEVYTLTFLTAKAAISPTLSAQADKTQGFLTSVQPFQLTSAEAHVKGQVSAEIPVSQILGVSIPENYRSFSADVLNQKLFQTPSLEATVTVQSNAYKVQGVADGGLTSVLVPDSIKWNFSPSVPLTDPADPSGVGLILVDINSNGCVAMSATDSVFGEFGRRFSNIENLTQPTVLNFTSLPFPPANGDPIYSSNGYNVYQVNVPGTSPAITVKRGDAMPFSYYGSDADNYLGATLHLKDGTEMRTLIYQSEGNQYVKIPLPVSNVVSVSYFNLPPPDTHNPVDPSAPAPTAVFNNFTAKVECSE